MAALSVDFESLFFLEKIGQRSQVLILSAGRLLIFFFDAEENFFAVNGDALGRIYADFDAFSVHINHGDTDIVVDTDGFAHLARQNQHYGMILSRNE